jgi:hypothetical protein
MPIRVYVTNGLVAAGLNVLLSAALGHPLGWVLSSVIGIVVGLSLSWSYMRRAESVRRTEPGKLDS